MTHSNLVRVVLWMVGALLSFSVMAVSIRLLAARGMSIFEILTIRGAVALIILGALMLVRPEFLFTTHSFAGTSPRSPGPPIEQATAPRL